MTTSRFDDDEERNARGNLLRYYTDECLAHGAYLLTIAIAFFTFAQILPDLKFQSPDIRALFISLILSLLFTIGVHILCRLIFWGSMTALVLWYPSMSKMDFLEKVLRGFSEIKTRYKEDPLTSLLMARLHWSCSFYYAKHHWFLGNFSRAEGSGNKRAHIIRAIVFVLSFILLYLIARAILI